MTTSAGTPTTSPRPTGPAAGGTGQRGLGLTVQAVVVGVCLAALARVALAAADVGRIWAPDVLRPRDLPLLLESLGLLAGLVLFVLWAALNRAEANRRLSRGARDGVVWTVLGWFVPFAGLVIPYVTTRDLVRRASRVAGRSAPGAPVLVWWLALLGAQGASAWASQVWATAGGSGALLLDVASAALYLLAGVLVVRLVRGVDTDLSGG